MSQPVEYERSALHDGADDLYKKLEPRTTEIRTGEHEGHGFYRDFHTLNTC